MGSVDSQWCHLHSRPVSQCSKILCKTNANDPSYNPGSFLKDGPPTPVSQPEPEDPIGPIAATGIEFHGVYTANIDAGFTPRQAIYLLAVQITGHPGTPPNELTADSQD